MIAPYRVSLQLAALVSAITIVTTVAQEAMAIPLAPSSAQVQGGNESEVVTETPFCANYTHELGASVVPKYARAKTKAKFNVLLEMERLKLGR